MSFSNALKVELCNSSYAVKLKKLPADFDGLMTINIFDDGKDTSFMSILLKHSLSKVCSLWKFTMEDDLMLNHMEDQVGIFDPDGLLAYAAYFRDALVYGPSVEILELSGQDEYPQAVEIVLQYKIGTTILEGRMKLSLAQHSLNSDLFTMMEMLYDFDPSRKIGVGTRNTLIVRKPNTDSATSVDNSATLGNDGTGVRVGTGADAGVSENEREGDSSSAAGSAGALSAAMKAKKRRVGGVNIFPGMRKK